MNLILLLLASFTFASELEVQGNLKVTGNIDAQNNPITNVGMPQAMTDAVNAQTLNNILTDDGVYEYMFVCTRMYSGVAYQSTFSISYKNYGDSDFTSNFEEHLNQLTLEGWIISKITEYAFDSSSQHYFNYYLFKRPIEE